MKTLTKILTVVTLVVLCVCLFSLTAFAEDKVIQKVYPEVPAKCETSGTYGYFTDKDNIMYNDPDGKVTTAMENTTYDVAGFEVITAPQTINALGHDFSIRDDSTDTATCKAEGTVQFKCSHTGCTAVATRVSPKKTTHRIDTSDTSDPSKYVGYVAPTCCQNGNMDYYICQDCFKKCSASGVEIADVTLYATGNHVWAEVNREEPTATTGGWILYECQQPGCTATKTTPLDPTGLKPSPNDAAHQLSPVIAERDTWFRGEETLLFRSDFIKWLNDNGNGTNRVGLRIGNDRSLYNGTYYTFDFWSYGEYVEFGDKMLNGMDAGTYYLWIYDREKPQDHTDSVAFYIVDVPTLEPYSTDKHVVNSSKSLRFIASEEIDPSSVKVGSKKLYDSSDYFVSNDRKNITLSPDFLNARQTGTYTISARTKGGDTIKTNFYILSTAQASSSPRTGDESQIGLWAAFLLLSGAAIVVMVPKLRKHGAK